MLYEVLCSLGIFRYGQDKRLVQAVYEGEFTIDGGALVTDKLRDGQFFAVIGSTFCDGVYRYGVDILPEDESFEGQVFALRYNHEFFTLIEEMEAWRSKNDTTGPYTSEDVGTYSYTRDTSIHGCMSAFRERLNPWRKV